MAKLRAAILAAGRGIRMGGEVPKALIPVADGEPLLHYALAGLRKEGIDDLLVVTGHRPQDIADYVTKEWGTEGVAFVRNARFASWGNFHSVRMALEQSPGADVLVVNCDVVVHPDVYRRVIATSGDLVLAVEERRRLDDEDMKVRLEGERVVGIGKNIDARKSAGEYAGVSLLRRKAAASYMQIATELEWQGRTDLYYEDVYALMLQVINARAALLGKGAYAEVDLPADMQAAAEVIARHREVWLTARPPETRPEEAEPPADQAEPPAGQNAEQAERQ